MKAKIKNIIMILIIIILCISNGVLLSSKELEHEIVKEPFNEEIIKEPIKDHSLEGNIKDNMQKPDWINKPPKDANKDIVNKPNYLKYGLLLVNCILISMIIAYIIMSKFNKKTLKNTFKDSKNIFIYSLASVLLAGALYLLNLYIPKMIQISLVPPVDNTEELKEEDIEEGKIVNSNTINLSKYKTNITIKEGGEYTLKGNFKNTVIIDSDSKVTLNLENVNIESKETSAILNKSNKKLTINLIGNNTLKDNGYSEFNACIYSKGKIEINGKGTLNINGNQTTGEGISTDEKDIIINNGIIIINSKDDGINAGGDKGGTIEINGGNITIKSLGDGIDSNKDIIINGGELYVMGSYRGGESALDSDNGIIINGGTIIALGTDMLEKPQTTSSQKSIALTLNETHNSGKTLILKNSKNKEILEFETKQKYKTIILSTPKLKSEKYNLYEEDKILYSNIEIK